MQSALLSHLSLRLVDGEATGAPEETPFKRLVSLEDHKDHPEDANPRLGLNSVLVLDTLETSSSSLFLIVHHIALSLQEGRQVLLLIAGTTARPPFAQRQSTRTSTTSTSRANWARHSQTYAPRYDVLAWASSLVMS